MKAAATVESSVSAVKLYPEEYSCNMYRMDNEILGRLQDELML